MEMQSKNNQAALNEAKHHRFLNLICWEDGANLGTNLITKKKTKQSNLDYFEHFYTVTLTDICTQPNMMKHDKTTPNKIYKWKYIFSH